MPSNTKIIRERLSQIRELYHIGIEVKLNKKLSTGAYKNRLPELSNKAIKDLVEETDWWLEEHAVEILSNKIQEYFQENEGMLPPVLRAEKEIQSAHEDLSPEY